MLVDMCDYIPTPSAELSTGNLLNANHTEENLEIINQIIDACEPGLTAAYLPGLIKASWVIKRNMLCCLNPWSD